MREPDKDARTRRIDLDNPHRHGGTGAETAAWPRRTIFTTLRHRLDKPGLVVLHGPRRAGKTTLARQIAGDALSAGLSPSSLLWLDLAAPVFRGVPLHELATALPASERSLLILDSVHRRPDWEREASDLAARSPIATILALSALRPQGAAFRLPHLGFREYLAWTGAERELIETMVFGRPGTNRAVMHTVRDIAEFNRRFRAHVVAGGFPEVVMSRRPGRDAIRALTGEVADTLLHSDLPALDRVGDGSELTRLLTLVVWNMGVETSFEELAEATGLAKNTVRRHLDHLIAAGLLVRLPRARAEGGGFQRMRTFKLHPATPTLRTVLFGPPTADRPLSPEILECAAITQWLGTPEADRLRFARLPEGTVDLIALDPETERPSWVCRISGDDASIETPPRGLVRFAELNAPLRRVEATTNTLTALKVHDGIEVWHRPLAQYCYEVGRRGADRD